MRLIKASNGKTKISLSKKEWEQIGRTAGWMTKKSSYDPDASYIASENLYQAIIDHSATQVINIIKEYAEKLNKLGIDTDTELFQEAEEIAKIAETLDKSSKDYRQHASQIADLLLPTLEQYEKEDSLRKNF
jgi:hypothetical protein